MTINIKIWRTLPHERHASCQYFSCSGDDKSTFKWMDSPQYPSVFLSGAVQVFCKWWRSSWPLAWLCFSQHQALANVSMWCNNESNGWMRKEPELNTAYRCVPGPLLNSAEGEGSPVCCEWSRLSLFLILALSFQLAPFHLPLLFSFSFSLYSLVSLWS